MLSRRRIGAIAASQLQIAIEVSWDGPAVLLPLQRATLARGCTNRSAPMPKPLNLQIAVIGIDIGKNSFHVPQELPNERNAHQ
jgi:hypothetical protein